MALVALDLDKADLRRHRIQGMSDSLVLHRGEQPVAGEGDDAETRRIHAKHVRKLAAMLARQVEIVHGAGDVEIGVRVKTVHESGALMMQIGFDLEIRREL